MPEVSLHDAYTETSPQLTTAIETTKTLLPLRLAAMSKPEQERIKELTQDYRQQPGVSPDISIPSDLISAMPGLLHNLVSLKTALDKQTTPENNTPLTDAEIAATAMPWYTVAGIAGPLRALNRILEIGNQHEAGGPFTAENVGEPGKYDTMRSMVSTIIEQSWPVQVFAKEYEKEIPAAAREYQTALATPSPTLTEAGGRTVDPTTPQKAAGI